MGLSEHGTSDSTCGSLIPDDMIRQCTTTTEESTPSLSRQTTEQSPQSPLDQCEVGYAATLGELPSMRQESKEVKPMKRIVSCPSKVMEIDAIDEVISSAISRDIIHGVTKAVISKCDFCVSVADPRTEDYELVAVSPGFEKMTGYSRSEVVGQNCRFLNDGCALDVKQRMGLRIASETGKQFHAVLQNRKRSGELFFNFLDVRGLILATNKKTKEDIWLLIGIQTEVPDTFLGEKEEATMMARLAEVADGIRKELRKELASLGLAVATIKNKKKDSRKKSKDKFRSEERYKSEEHDESQKEHEDEQSWSLKQNVEWVTGGCFEGLEHMFVKSSSVDTSSQMTATENRFREPSHSEVKTLGTTSVDMSSQRSPTQPSEVNSEVGLQGFCMWAPVATAIVLPWLLATIYRAYKRF